MASVYELAGAERAKSEAVRRREACAATLARHMYEISDDSSGSDPAQYLGGEEVEELHRFLDMVEGQDFPNAEEILDMRVRRFGWQPRNAWNSSYQTAKAGLTMRLFFPQVNDTQSGYVFGRLNMQSGQQVAVGAKDRLLYSHRWTEIYESKGIGWGRLPDPEYLLPAIEPVRRMLYWKPPSKPLGEILLSRVNPWELPQLGS